MKTLYLLRHFKSSWNDIGLDDHERPLSPRGHRSAAPMAQYMKSNGYIPQKILCSSARRTVETLELIRPVIGPDIPAQVEDSLYLASARSLLARVQQADEACDSLLMIGHNPGFEDLAAVLFDPDASARPLPDKFPTGGLAIFGFKAGNWSSVAAHAGRLSDFAKPRDFID